MPLLSKSTYSFFPPLETGTVSVSGVTPLSKRSLNSFSEITVICSLRKKALMESRSVFTRSAYVSVSSQATIENMAATAITINKIFFIMIFYSFFSGKGTKKITD